jgi:peroxiredoxin (alkyl hydroperoxide reductase subunit C)
MTIRLGDIAPDFTVDTTTGTINFHEWIGDSWAFFFSHPADFTPVCTTEMGRTAQLASEFTVRNVKPLGLSTDGVEEHLKWIDDVNDTQSCNLIDPNKKVRLTLTYPMAVGRNFDEILRVIDALQLADAKNCALPADWRVGGDVIIPPPISDEKAKDTFPNGWVELRPYLRMTKL